MQTLKLAPELFLALERGIKKVTIRLGQRDVTLGRLLFESTTNVDVKKSVFVRSVTLTRFIDLSPDVVQAEGAKDLDELYEAMRKFYPNLMWHDVVTVITWL